MQARITTQEELERVPLLGTTHIVLISGKQTEGRFSSAILEIPPGTGVPPHVHEREDELFHVMEGEIEFFVDGKSLTAGAGSTFFGPRRIPHGFRCTGARLARLMVTICPAGIDDMFIELSRLPGGKPDPQEVAAICAKYGVRFV